MERQSPRVMLVILDGWGWSPISFGNLLVEVDTPGLDTLIDLGSWTLLKTASSEIGLPWGSVGDSELGHFNLGTGRIVVAYPGKKTPTLVEIMEREQALLDVAIMEQQQRERSIRNPEALQAPVSLGGLLAAYGLHQVKIGQTAKWGVLTAAMNGYPLQPIPEEAFIRLDAMEKIDHLSEEHPDLLAANFVAVNLAAADQAAHTGDLTAVRRAVRTTDFHLQQLAQIAYQQEMVLYLTSDHGNIEQMLSEHDQPIPSHTTAPVIFLRVDFRRHRQPIVWNHHPRRKERVATTMPTGVLADVAPTILEEFHLSIPDSMVGISLRQHLIHSRKL